MSAKKTSEDSEPGNETEETETETAPQAESQSKPEEEAQPKPEAQAQPEAKSTAKGKVKAEGEVKPAAKPGGTKTLAEIMKFDLRIGKKPRR
jgi:hypothetical protein